MSDIYQNLKAEAAKKRQAAVVRARREYQDTLKQIDALRSRLGYEAPPGKPKRRRSTPDLIADVMPRQRQFTFAEIHQALCEAEPNRDFNQLSIRTTLRQMAQQGILQSVGRNAKGRAAWIASGETVEISPHATKTLPEVAILILKDRGPLTPAALVVAIREIGYRPDAQPRDLLAALRSSVRRYPGRFTVGDDGRWSVT